MYVGIDELYEFDVFEQDKGIHEIPRRNNYKAQIQTQMVQKEKSCNFNGIKGINKMVIEA